MRCIALFLSLSCLAAPVWVTGAEPAAEFDRLQGSYQAAVERETAPLRQTYLAELEKLRESYTRAGNLAGANTVQAEIVAMNQQIAFAKTGKRAPTEPVAPGTVRAVTPVNPVAGAEMPELRWFVGKTWLTDASTKWNFEKDGTGDRVRGNQKVAIFKWRLLPSGTVEISERTAPDKPVTLVYLRFKNKTEAWFGSSETNLNARLHYE